MPLNPTITLSHDSAGTLTITDNSTYGGGNPDRGDVTISVAITNKLPGNDKNISANTYDPVVDTTFTAGVGDSWIRATLTYSYDDGGPVTETATGDLVYVAGLVTCADGFRADFVGTCCGCESKRAMTLWMKMQAGLAAVNIAVAAGNLADAACIISNLTSLCNSEVCDDC